MSISITNVSLIKGNITQEVSTKTTSTMPSISFVLMLMLDISHTTIGTSTPDSVTVTLQCRGDSYGSKCRTCIDIAVAGFRNRCPKNKGGIIGCDQCFFYINSIYEELPIRTNYDNMFSMYNPNNVRGDAKLFAKRAVDFFSELNT
ncbi:unnamed protein product [Brassica oleracea]|uniref:(rape) hypothetical protein n=1 Tax=Brassica napus TaxID=3708 RepID=A0A816JIK1_BRANA|nr:unnamed protein product [Brassica napus]